MAGSEIFTTCQMTMRFKVKIWNSDLGKLKKYNVEGGGGTILVYMCYLDIVLKKEL